MLIVPMRTYRGLNDREHPMVRHRRVQREKREIAIELMQYGRHHEKPPIPCTVTLTRLGPSAGLDDDNLVAALKSTRDSIAAWLQVDDKFRDIVRYAYHQKWAPEWGVKIEFKPGIKP